MVVIIQDNHKHLHDLHLNGMELPTAYPFNFTSTSAYQKSQDLVKRSLEKCKVDIEDKKHNKLNFQSFPINLISYKVFG